MASCGFYIYNGIHNLKLRIQTKGMGIGKNKKSGHVRFYGR
jgi:hypothetical protein